MFFKGSIFYVYLYFYYVIVFQFERAFDATADYIWESRNQGKLWKDIKHKYDTPADEE